MRYKKVIALGLCMMMLMLALCACDKKIFITVGLKDSEAFKLSGQPCTMSEMMLVLMTEKSRYESDLGDGIWLSAGSSDSATLEDDIKQKVKNEMVELKTIVAFADKKNIKLSDEEKLNLTAAATEYMSTLSDDVKTALNVSLSDVENLYTSFYKVEKVYDKITQDVVVEISDEEARVIEVNYIFIATCRLDADNNKLPFSENELAAANAKAEKVKELVAKGSDFVSLVKDYSDSTEYERVFSRGQLIEDIEEVAFQLEVGEVSDIITTEDGYYFIKCVDDYLENETAANKAKMEDNIKKTTYEEVYNPFKAEQTLEFNNKIWNALELADYSDIDTLKLYEIYNKHMN